MFRPCAIVPSRNHADALPSIVGKLRAAGLPVFIIDDASDEATRQAIATLNAPERSILVHRFEDNQGKGGAVIKGFQLAEAGGFTHAVQVDADGQHDLSGLRQLLSLGESHGDALVLGAPVFDRTMPRARRWGRWITHFWVAIETMSPNFIDTMCGFRLYPLAPVMALLREERVGLRMEFDTEIAVRLIWRGVPQLRFPVRVTYPPSNVSNFDLVRDNWRIGKAHARLIVTLLARLTRIRRSRSPRNDAAHWSGLAERGAYWGLLLIAWIYHTAGPYGSMAILLPVTLYFHVTGAEQRRASRLFLERAFAALGKPRGPNWLDELRHSLNFARKAVETFGAWVANVDVNRLEMPGKSEVARLAESGRGIVLIVSHLGNIELSRALLDRATRSRIVLLVHTRHAETHARMLRRFRPEAELETLQVGEINPATIMALRDKVEQGGWVAIAGDRTPIGGGGRVSCARFLGHEAPFPHGPYVLAHLLECPVYLMFCLRENGHHRLYFERFAERIELPRRERAAALAELAARYAARLEFYCLRDPLQWYNFYNFWAAEARTA
jgi:predicted LPLAT superfamily acyltransferase